MDITFNPASGRWLTVYTWNTWVIAGRISFYDIYNSHTLGNIALYLHHGGFVEYSFNHEGDLVAIPLG